MSSNQPEKRLTIGDIKEELSKLGKPDKLDLSGKNLSRIDFTELTTHDLSCQE